MRKAVLTTDKTGFHGWERNGSDLKPRDRRKTRKLKRWKCDMRTRGSSSLQRMEGVGLAGARPSKERRRHLTLTLSPEAERGSLPVRFGAPGQGRGGGRGRSH